MISVMFVLAAFPKMRQWLLFTISVYAVCLRFYACGYVQRHSLVRPKGVHSILSNSVSPTGSLCGVVANRYHTPSFISSNKDLTRVDGVAPSSSRGTRGIPSKTSRESAIFVEWEPMTELERRIEDGINYEHIPSPGPASGRKTNSGRSSQNLDDDISEVRGVFCGYRYTTNEYDRLKSADPAID